MVWLSCIALVTSSVSCFSGVKVAGGRTHFILMALLAFAIVASLASKQLFGLSITALLNFSPSATLYLLTLINVNSMGRLKRSCATVACCALLLAITSITSYHTGFMADRLVLRQTVEYDETSELQSEVGNLIPALDASGKYLWRVRSFGFLADPNDFAQFIILALPLLFGFYRPSRNLLNLLLVYIPACTFLYTIYLTHSRGALLGVVAIILFSSKRKFGLAPMILAMIAIGVASLLGGGRGFSSGEDSASGRIDAWFEGLNMLYAYPLLGVGYGRFLDHHYLTAHNAFVLCFAELGLFGYFVWIAMIVCAIKALNEALQFLSPDCEERRWCKLLRTSIVGFLVCAFFLSRTYAPSLYLLLALCICAARCGQWHLENLQTRSAPRPWHEIEWARTSMLVVLISISIIYLVVRMR